jgi:hypothetical protein
MYNKVTLVNVDNKEDNPYPIKIKLETGCCIILTKYGQYTDADFAKCVIYPKGRTTWEGFVPPCKFKDGDIITCNNDACTFISIFKDKLIEKIFQKHCSVILDDNKFIVGIKYADYANPRLATEEEKEKLFKAIKDNGYQWNPETKTLEKLIEPKFKDGDIISDSLGTCIFKGEGRIKGTVNFYCGINNDYFQVKDDKCNPNGHYGDIVDYRLATEEEKQKLFDAIKANGYKWNAETKTLEDLTESKEDVDDEILISGIYFDREYHADEVELHLGNYEIEIRDGRTYAVLKNQKTKTFELPKFKVGDEIKQIGSDRHYIIKNIEFDRYILNNNQFIRFTDEHIYELAPNKLVEPKFKVGDRIVKKNSVCVPILITNVSDEFYYSNTESSVGILSISEQDEYTLLPNKFDITTLVPFESKVLVRDCNYHEWVGEIFVRYADKSFNNCNFVTLGGQRWKQCIPYNDDTKYLLGTTNDCNDYYKNWK